MLANTQINKTYYFIYIYITYFFFIQKCLFHRVSDNFIIPNRRHCVRHNQYCRTYSPLSNSSARPFLTISNAFRAWSPSCVEDAMPEREMLRKC